MDQTQRGLNENERAQSREREREERLRRHYSQQMDSDEIKHSIESTRHDMDATLEAIARQLHPRPLLLTLVNSVWPEQESHIAGRKDAMEKAQALGMQISEIAKRSPIPLALAGIGLVWLGVDMLRATRNSAIHGRQAGSSTVDARTGQPYSSTYGSEFAGKSASDFDETGYEGGRLGESYVNAQTGKAYSSSEPGKQYGERGAMARARIKKDELKSKAHAKTEKIKERVRETTELARERVHAKSERARQERREIDGSDYGTSA